MIIKKNNLILTWKFKKKTVQKYFTFACKYNTKLDMFEWKTRISF